MKCERCESTEGVELEPCRTMYALPHLNGWQRLMLDDEGLAEVPDPNRDSWLCRDCAEDHHSYWDEMWSYVPQG